MSAQFRSHHRPPIQQETAAPSRIPTKAGTIERGSSKSTQNISRAPRKSVGGAPASDHAVHSRRSNITASVPVTAGRLDPFVTQGVTVPPHSEAPSASQYSRRTSYGTGLQPHPTIKTPSLVSGSSVRSPDSPRSHGLRRKPSTIDSYTAQMRARGSRSEADRATMHSRGECYNDVLDDAVLGISLPPTGKPEYRDSYLRSAAPARLLPNLDTQNTAPFRDITPPVPGLSHSATPSTRCTDSPYSHVPTPNSALSHHSGGIAGVTENSKQSSNSPLRPRPTPPFKDVPQQDTSRKALAPTSQMSTSSSQSTIKAKHNNTSSTGSKVSESARPAQQRRSSNQSRLPAPNKKPPTSTQTSKDTVHIPPELAHLNVDTPVNPRMSTTLPPRRPSRSRTPSLTNVNDPSPVVHSDLPRLYTTYHKRTPSQDTNGSATSTSFRSRFGFSPRSSSKQGSPRVDSAFSPSPSSRKHKQPPTPETVDPDRPRLLRKDSPALNKAPSPAPSKSPRFSFLSRKSKANIDKATEKPKREARKGPVAGTGHERYARFGFRGRSSSTASPQPFSRSPSADSNTSAAPRQGTGRKGSTTSEDNSDMDEFLRERLNPVVIRGRGVSFGNQTQIWATKGEESSSSPSMENLPEPQLLPSAMAASNSSSLDESPHPKKKQHNDSINDELARRPEPAAQESPEQTSNGDQEALRIPPPINTNMASQTSSLDSYEGDSSAYPPTDSTTPPQEANEGKEGLWLRPLKKEPTAPRLKHKWNFLQRAQSSQFNGKQTVNSDELSAPFRPYQDALHLGILDAVEPIELAEVERIIYDHDASTSGSSATGTRHSRVLSSESNRTNPWASPAKSSLRVSDTSDAQRLSPSVMASQILTESPELLQARAAVSKQPGQVVRMKIAPLMVTQANAPTQYPQEVLQNAATPELVHEAGDTPETPRSADIARQPRLSPVGRIPLVISKRDRDRRLPDNSFSRPFVSNQPRPTVRPPGSLYNQIRDLASYVDSGSQPVSSTSGRSDSASAVNHSSINNDQPSASTNRSSFEFYAGSDFITFAPRKNSEQTYSSSSSGASNWMALHAQEDDIWNEYNDLMDDVMPEKTPISAGSSLGAPFQYSNVLQDNHSPAMPAPLNLERAAPQQHTETLQLPLAVPGNREFNSYQQNPPVSPMAPEEHKAVALAEAQQDDRFTSRPVSPLTPDTLAQFVGTYGDRSTTSSFAQNRLSVPQTHLSSLPMHRSSISSRHSRGSRHSRSASLPEANARNSQISLAPSARFNRDTQLLDIQERESDQKSPTANLRFGALMTSKWLSFGRILFSPAHNEVRLADEPRVLVVDGLGDDWSHYVAASYPNAIVCNLSVSNTSSTESKDWDSLPNYRHYDHQSLSTAFPFPKGFFTAVVFRFPIAATEHTYQACILECKRVLRPGGHLEVVALDIDMMNMGTRGRRALRGLKTRMQQRDQDVSLRNLSDGLVRMIGRRGFEDVQRCIVGVPAAGRIPRSDDLRSSSCSSNSTSGRPHRSDSSSTDSQDKDLSFAALLQNNRNSQLVGPGHANDEGITKMVARVGRFWYSACYEQQLLETDKSVWREPGLLRECEKQGTSFRLLICCAQKPLQTRRRTVSV
ncbi:hypothetical protein Q7P37_007341 [Cladosporium fusiforme]